MNEIQLNTDGLMRQAGLTADDYISMSTRILKSHFNTESFTVSDVVELSKVMAQDFHTSMLAVKMQEIRDAIKKSAATT